MCVLVCRNKERDMGTERERARERERQRERERARERDETVWVQQQSSTSLKFRV